MKDPAMNTERRGVCLTCGELVPQGCCTCGPKQLLQPFSLKQAALFEAAPKLLEALDWIAWEIEWGCADRDAILRVAQEAIKEATP